MTDRHAQRYLQAAAAALEQCAVDRAEQYLGLLAESAPDNPEYLRLTALARDARGDNDAALMLIRRAVAIRADDAVLQNTVGTMLMHAGDFAGAAAAFARASALQPSLAIAHYNRGVALMRLARYAEAADAFRAALERAPSLGAARVRLADALRDAGDAQAALAAYRQVLTMQPESGAAWCGLADLHTVAFTAADREAMRDALRSAGPTDRVGIGYALAHAYEDVGAYADALATLVQAKADAQRRQRWDAAGFSRGALAMRAAFPDLRVAATQCTLGREVVFVVGMPRSGSTLVEQILAAHSAVEGAGELADLPAVLQDESRRRGRPFPDWASAATTADWQRLGREYLARTARWRRTRARHVDKLPSNWQFIGAILATLPAARIVCCRRDALETCFACYRQQRATLDYAGTFADLAAFWRDYDAAVREWAGRFPERVYEHSYESLLRNPAAAIRRLLAFCDLPWEPACLAFHAVERSVHTPSAMQVRSPLVHPAPRAARYGTLLDPLRAELGLPPFVA